MINQEGQDGAAVAWDLNRPIDLHNLSLLFAHLEIMLISE